MPRGRGPTSPGIWKESDAMSTSNPSEYDPDALQAEIAELGQNLVDLARMAGLKSAGVICEVMDEDGTMARMPSLEKFSETHGVGICAIADLVEYRMLNESFVHRSADAVIPTSFGGEFKMIAFENDVDNLLHIALVKGDIDPEIPTLVRVHSECMTGDIFGSMR